MEQEVIMALSPVEQYLAVLTDYLPPSQKNLPEAWALAAHLEAGYDLSNFNNPQATQKIFREVTGDSNAPEAARQLALSILAQAFGEVIAGTVQKTADCPYELGAVKRWYLEHLGYRQIRFLQNGRAEVSNPRLANANRGHFFTARFEGRDIVVYSGLGIVMTKAPVTRHRDWLARALQHIKDIQADDPKFTLPLAQTAGQAVAAKPVQPVGADLCVRPELEAPVAPGVPGGQAHRPAPTEVPVPTPATTEDQRFAAIKKLLEAHGYSNIRQDGKIIKADKQGKFLDRYEIKEVGGALLCHKVINVHGRVLKETIPNWKHVAGLDQVTAPAPGAIPAPSQEPRRPISNPQIAPAANPPPARAVQVGPVTAKDFDLENLRVWYLEYLQYRVGDKRTGFATSSIVYPIARKDRPGVSGTASFLNNGDLEILLQYDGEPFGNSTKKNWLINAVIEAGRLPPEELAPLLKKSPPPPAIWRGERPGGLLSGLQAVEMGPTTGAYPSVGAPPRGRPEPAPVAPASPRQAQGPAPTTATTLDQKMREAFRAVQSQIAAHAKSPGNESLQQFIIHHALHEYDRRDLWASLPSHFVGHDKGYEHGQILMPLVYVAGVLEEAIKCLELYEKRDERSPVVLDLLEQLQEPWFINNDFSLRQATGAFGEVFERLDVKRDPAFEPLHRALGLYLSLAALQEKRKFHGDAGKFDDQINVLFGAMAGSVSYEAYRRFEKWNFRREGFPGAAEECIRKAFFAVREALPRSVRGYATVSFLCREWAGYLETSTETFGGKIQKLTRLQLTMDALCHGIYDKLDPQTAQEFYDVLTAFTKEDSLGTSELKGFPDYHRYVADFGSVVAQLKEWSRGEPFTGRRAPLLASASIPEQVRAADEVVIARLRAQNKSRSASGRPELQATDSLPFLYVSGVMRQALEVRAWLTEKYPSSSLIGWIDMLNEQAPSETRFTLNYYLQWLQKFGQVKAPEINSLRNALGLFLSIAALQEESGPTDTTTFAKPIEILKKGLLLLSNYRDYWVFEDWYYSLDLKTIDGKTGYCLDQAFIALRARLDSDIGALSMVAERCRYYLANRPYYSWVTREVCQQLEDIQRVLSGYCAGTISALASFEARSFHHNLSRIGEKLLYPFGDELKGQWQVAMEWLNQKKGATGGGGGSGRGPTFDLGLDSVRGPTVDLSGEPGTKPKAVGANLVFALPVGHESGRTQGSPLQAITSAVSTKRFPLVRPVRQVRLVGSAPLAPQGSRALRATGTVTPHNPLLRTGVSIFNQGPALRWR